MRRLRVSRLVRGSFAAAGATFVAQLSHVSAGGAMPGWIGIIVPLTISVPVCVALAGRNLSAVRLALAVATSQVLFHTLFVLGTFTPSGGVTAGHSHVHEASMSMPATPATGSSAGSADLAMWLAHAIAAVITVAVIHRGEATVRRLLELAHRVAAWVRRRILSPSVLPSPLVPRLVRAAEVSVRPALSVVVAACSRRRGPPVVRTV